jgi:hypothetical protein
MLSMKRDERSAFGLFNQLLIAIEGREHQRDISNVLSWDGCSLSDRVFS